MKDKLDLNTISDLISTNSEALNRPRVALYHTKNEEKHDLDIAIWACCHGNHSSRHHSTLLLVLDAGANPNICNSTIHKKANKSNHWLSKNLQLLDTLLELYKGGHEGVDHMARALVLHGAKFDHYLNPNRYADKLWVELFLGWRCIEESDWPSSKGWIEMFRK